MSIHLCVRVECEESSQQCKSLGYDVVRDAMVLNVEEATLVASIVDGLGNSSFGVKGGGAVDVCQVDCGNRGEGGRLLCNLPVRRLGAGMEVYELFIVLDL